MEMRKRSTVQMFIRNVIRLVIVIPLFLLLIYPDFQKIGEMILYGLPGDLVFGLALPFSKPFSFSGLPILWQIPFTFFRNGNVWFY